MPTPHRPALAPALALLAGIAGASLVPVSQASFWPAAPTLLLGAALLRRRRRWARALLLAAVAVAGLALGASDLGERARRVTAWIPTRPGVWEGEVEGVVLRAAEREADGSRALLLRAASCTLLVRVRVPAGSPEAAVLGVDALRKGDRVRAWCRLRRSLPLGNPGARDPEDSLRARGIDLAGSVKTVSLVERVERGRWSAGRALDAGTVWLRRRLDRALRPGDARGLVGAMLLGERGALSPEAMGALRDSGTFHVLSVSGLHVALLLGASLLPLRRARPLLRLGAAAVVLSALHGVVGPQPPVSRAIAAAGLALVGRAIGRSGDGLNTLALAAAALVLDRPGRLLDVGFQLSFLATAGLLAATRPATACIPLPRALALPLGASAAAYVATAPALAWHLGRLAPVGLLANLVAAPACGAVMATGALTLLLADVPILGQAVARLAEACAEQTLLAARAAADVPWGALTVARPSPALLALLAGTLLLAWSRPRHSPARAASGLVFALAFAFLHLGPPPPAPAPAEVSLLDVGQGLAVLIRGPAGQAVLVDAGGRGGGAFDAGERVVVPAVSRLGLRRVEVLVLTHGHDDHAGGALAVLRALEVGELWIGPGWTEEPLAREAAALARRRGAAVVLVERGFAAQRAGCALRVPHPAREAPLRHNDRCVALLCRAGSARLLVPGDVERDGALALAGSGDVAADALVVAHHGSRTGTPRALLDAVRPRLALVSAGRDNVYGHPHREILTRLRRSGVAVRRTDRDGCIRLVENAAGWSEGEGEERQHEEQREQDENQQPRATHAPAFVGQARVPVAHEDEHHRPEDVR